MTEGLGLIELGVLLLEELSHVVHDEREDADGSATNHAAQQGATLCLKSPDKSGELKQDGDNDWSQKLVLDLNHATMLSGKGVQDSDYQIERS